MSGEIPPAIERLKQQALDGDPDNALTSLYIRGILNGSREEVAAARTVINEILDMKSGDARRVLLKTKI
ncbi:MAG: hypothetical protein UV80_C0002G0070 [Candidatus Peregrinibacteria bacterium GW2011_GWF2_43_17]|nr:MAG: hypothetical protein UV80_C0002G0070 [Candidatus Peregrinibacteria bacterium GW2011_GWF2_43_17]KKT20598.1 MAG: hypothetical protein UW03_C0002G0064 [Candidatus Peregrinibacteria bacterium GW2011_GWA2_43_8]HAU39883.1 hypothetical protein [Candidatus Peregrinibacteria bacterium]